MSFAKSIKLYKSDYNKNTANIEGMMCGGEMCSRDCDCDVCPKCLYRRFVKSHDGVSRLGRLLNIDNLLIIALLICALYYKGAQTHAPDEYDNFLTGVICVLIIVLIIRFML